MSAVCKDLRSSFHLSQFKMVRFFVPLNSVEKDLNKQLLSLSTTIDCRFRVSFGRSCCAMASHHDRAVDLDLLV